MKARLYIKPEIDILTAYLGDRLLDFQTNDHGDANTFDFFAEEDHDDDHDPFFDD